MEMGEKIKVLRESKGMTLEELGNKVGVGKSTVRKWETGAIANMKRDKIANVAKALDVSPSYLMGWEETPKEELQLSNTYLSFAKQAQDEGIDPKDIEMALEFIKKSRGEL